MFFLFSVLPGPEEWWGRSCPPPRSRRSWCPPGCGHGREIWHEWRGCPPRATLQSRWITEWCQRAELEPEYGRQSSFQLKALSVLNGFALDSCVISLEYKNDTRTAEDNCDNFYLWSLELGLLSWWRRSWGISQMCHPTEQLYHPFLQSQIPIETQQRHIYDAITSSLPNMSLSCYYIKKEIKVRGKRKWSNVILLC